MMTIGLSHYLVVAAALFCAGIFTMMTKRNAIGILIGVELVLNSTVLNLVAFACYLYRGAGKVDGQIFAIFVIVLAAAEAAIAVGICINLYKNWWTVDVDKASTLQG